MEVVELGPSVCVCVCVDRCVYSVLPFDHFYQMFLRENTTACEIASNPKELEDERHSRLQKQKCEK